MRYGQSCEGIHFWSKNWRDREWRGSDSWARTLRVECRGRTHQKTALLTSGGVSYLACFCVGRGGQEIHTYTHSRYGEEILWKLNSKQIWFKCYLSKYSARYQRFLALISENFENSFWKKLEYLHLNEAVGMTSNWIHIKVTEDWHSHNITRLSRTMYISSFISWTFTNKLIPWTLLRCKLNPNKYDPRSLCTYPETE